MSVSLVHCFCMVCGGKFAKANGAYLQRVNHKQEVKEVCTSYRVHRRYDDVPDCHRNEGRSAGGVPEH